jgi:hypothetical protein
MYARCLAYLALSSLLLQGTYCVKVPVKSQPSGYPKDSGSAAKTEQSVKKEQPKISFVHGSKPPPIDQVEQYEFSTYANNPRALSNAVLREVEAQTRARRPRSKV